MLKLAANPKNDGSSSHHTLKPFLPCSSPNQGFMTRDPAEPSLRPVPLLIRSRGSPTRRSAGEALLEQGDAAATPPGQLARDLNLCFPNASGLSHSAVAPARTRYRNATVAIAGSAAWL